MFAPDDIISPSDHALARWLELHPCGDVQTMIAAVRAGTEIPPEIVTSLTGRVQTRAHAGDLFVASPDGRGVFVMRRRPAYVVVITTLRLMPEAAAWLAANYTAGGAPTVSALRSRAKDSLTKDDAADAAVRPKTACADCEFRKTRPGAVVCAHTTFGTGWRKMKSSRVARGDYAPAWCPLREVAS